MPDPRHRRGVRHPLTTILAITITITIAAAAVAAGARSVTAIGEEPPRPPTRSWPPWTPATTRATTTPGRAPKLWTRPRSAACRNAWTDHHTHAAHRARPRPLPDRAGHGLRVHRERENQHRLYAPLDGLDWPAAPRHTITDSSHARRERRTIQVLPAPADVGFSGAAQVFLIKRYVTDPATGRISAVAVRGITSLTAEQAGPDRLAR